MSVKTEKFNMMSLKTEKIKLELDKFLYLIPDGPAVFPE